jgi:small-conductance mechanosensitive channel
MKNKRLLCLIALLATLSLLLAACGAADLEQLFGLVGAEGSEEEASVLPEETATPAPTPTPGVVTEVVSEVTSATGLDQKEVLGLPVEDWINLGVSLVFVVAGILLGTWLIKSVLRRLVRRTETEFDDLFLETIGSQLRWLVAIFVAEFSLSRLPFLSVDLRQILDEVFFFTYLVVGVIIAWKLLDFAVEWYRERVAPHEDRARFEPMVILAARIGRIIALILAVNVLLGHFGINITGLAATLGVVGLALSLAAQDTLSDAISGFIILADRPFRVGDRIEIQGLGTWGDVVDIGLRTTRIRTRDNRMVIVPNSTIGKNQVVNYSFPDPRFRVQTHVGIGYGADIERVRQIMIDTVRGIEGVLPDRPVDALYVEMGDSAMIFRVRWWIESYRDTRQMYDSIHTALQEALDAAGVDMPYPTYDVIVKAEGPEQTEG